MGPVRWLGRTVGGVLRRLPFARQVEEAGQRLEQHVKGLNAIKLHDFINLVAIGGLNVLNLIHLGLGRGFTVLATACMTYFVADIGYIAAFPHSAKNALVIAIHHVVSGMYLVVPWKLPRFRKMMSLVCLVEINTWLQIARKTFPHKLLEASFYATWVGIRLIYFPSLIPRFLQLWWQSTSGAEGGRDPLLLAATGFHGFLTSLNYYWTFELLVRVGNRRSRSAVTAKSKLESQVGVVNVTALPDAAQDSPAAISKAVQQQQEEQQQEEEQKQQQQQPAA